MQKPSGAAHRLLGVDVEAHDLDEELPLHPFRDAADRADLAVEIEEDAVALRRRVPFEDFRDAEAPLEIRPDVGPEPVAAGEADACASSPADASGCSGDSGRARRYRWKTVQSWRTMSSQNIDWRRSARGCTTLAPAVSAAPGAEHAAGRVVQRQADIDAVVGLACASRALKPNMMPWTR